MDFIMDFLLFFGYDLIWVIVDMFMKIVYFIFLCVEVKKIDDLIWIFVCEYWWFYGVLVDIILDCDLCFIVYLWKDFLKFVGIKSCISMVFYL